MELSEQAFLCWGSFGHPSPRSFPDFCREEEHSGSAVQGKRWALPRSVPEASLEGHCLALDRPLVRLQWLLTFQLQSNSFQADACRSAGCQIQGLALHVQNCLCDLFAGHS